MPGHPVTRPRWRVLSRLALPGVIELALLIAIIAAYQVTKYWATADVARAFANARALYGWQELLYLDVELPLQRSMLEHPRLVALVNAFYVHSHFNATLLFFIWLFLAHGPRYPRVRNAFALLHGLALALFVVYPCAPPRMLPDLGFVDTIAVMSGGLPYSGVHNPYAAFPSVHFAYAFFFAVVALAVSPNRWIHALTLIYALAVLLAITATGNHYIVDSLGGMVVALAALGVIRPTRPRLAADLDRARNRGENTP